MKGKLRRAVSHTRLRLPGGAPLPLPQNQIEFKGLDCQNPSRSKTGLKPIGDCLLVIIISIRVIVVIGISRWAALDTSQA